MRLNIPIRPRRNRASFQIRELVREVRVSASDLILPLFVIEGDKLEEPVFSMPGISRYSIDLVVEKAVEAFGLGIPAIALFPRIDKALKNSQASEAINPTGLIQRTVSIIKKTLPDIIVITDVALDPYSSDGHDGILFNNEIVNDQTVKILCRMAVSQAEAGADIVAPSDMMDGRIGFIRKALDEANFSRVGIMSYTAKYASNFYGPFREALNSGLKVGDKRTYQMDPGNSREALRELQLDTQEGADIVMVKPALPYLDVINRIRSQSNLPIAAYQVSGEYAMIKLAEKEGWLDISNAMEETLVSIKRAGADMILTYFALEMAKYCKRDTI